MKFCSENEAIGVSDISEARESRYEYTLACSMKAVYGGPAKT